MSVKSLIYDGFESLKPLVDEIIANGVPVSAIEHTGYRNRLYTLDTPLGKINIKAFRQPSFPNNYIYTTLRKSKARRSGEHAVRLLESGVGTPRPVAWIEKKSEGQLRESYYLSVEEPFDGDLRYWEKRPEKERDELLDAYSQFLFGIHEKGILHHDLSPGNVIWKRDKRGQYSFMLVDLNRMSFFNHPLSKKQRLSNFRNINELPEETRRLALLYDYKSDSYRPIFAEKAVATLNKQKRRKTRLRRLKSFFRKKK